MMSVFDEYRALSHGMMNAAPVTEPAPRLVNNKPSLDGSRCNAFKPTTGINAGITEMNTAKRAFRAKTI
jgi:hypothetical protein